MSLNVYMVHYYFSPGVIVTDLQKRGGLSDDKYSEVNIYSTLDSGMEILNNFIILAIKVQSSNSEFMLTSCIAESCLLLCLLLS